MEDVNGKQVLLLSGAAGSGKSMATRKLLLHLLGPYTERRMRESSVRVVVLINYDSLKADRGRGVKELIKILRDLFGDVDALLAHEGAVLVGVSKVPKLVDDEENELSDVMEMLTDISGLSEASGGPGT